MRIIGRTLAIIAAALVVAGITFGVAQSSGAQSLGPNRQMPGAATAGQSAGGTINASRPRPNGFEHEGNRTPSLFGAVEIVKDVAIIGVIVALVAQATRMIRGRRPAGAARRAEIIENT
jgi:hypothetical protein